MRYLAIAIMAVLMTGVARGQTTRPAGEDSAAVAANSAARWERMVSSLAAALAAHNADNIQALLPSGCIIHKFGGDRDADAAAMVDTLRDLSVLGDHAYQFPCSTLADDIATDINASQIVPDSAKHSLELDDPNAQTVAVKWVGQNLSAEDGTSIGIIILWPTHPEADETRRPSFVLIKGFKDARDSRFAEIVYGDPLK